MFCAVSVAGKMSVVASDILFVRGDGGYRPGLTSPVASLDLVKQTGGPHSSSTVSSKDSAVFDEFHHSPRWLAKNRHNAQKAAKYKQVSGRTLLLCRCLCSYVRHGKMML